MTNIYIYIAQYQNKTFFVQPVAKYIVKAQVFIKSHWNHTTILVNLQFDRRGVTF